MTVAAQFQDRYEAGRFLAEKLEHIRHNSLRVLALSADSLPAAFEVAKALGAPLDIFLVERFFAPGYEDVPVGIIASGRVRIFNDVAVRQLGISEEVVLGLAQKSEERLRQREKDYRGDAKAVRIEGHNVLLIADGLSIAVNIRAAVQALRARRVRSIYFAAPVGSMDTCHELSHDVDEIICGMTPEPLYSVGAWYSDFIQVSNTECRRLLKEAAEKSRRVRQNEKR